MSSGTQKQKLKPKRKKNTGKRGNQTQFKTDYVRMATPLGEAGFTDAQIGVVFNVQAQSIRIWRKKYPAFDNALKKAKQTADEQVEQALFKRAMGYEHPDVDIRTVAIGDGRSTIVQTPIIKHYAPDTTACIFWLKNRQPNKWRDRTEHTGDEGGAIKVEVDYDLSRLSVEQLLALKAALAAAKKTPDAATAEKSN